MCRVAKLRNLRSPREFAMATADEPSSSSRRPSRLPAAANAVLTAGSLFGAVSKVRNNSKCSAAELSTSFAEQAATRWGRKRERILLAIPEALDVSTGYVREVRVRRGAGRGPAGRDSRSASSIWKTSRTRSTVPYVSRRGTRAATV